MLIPKKLKHRKISRGTMRGNSLRGSELSFGNFGLKATSRGWVSARQIEAARRAITHYIRRGGKVWIRIFPDKPITKMAAETGMGGGKGSLDHFVAVVLPGRMIFEIGGISEEIAKEALRLASHKLQVQTRFIKKDLS
ncbi:MAG: 50S ribosomal protein L16 [Berkelbacteria bacterium GW2011_GWA1_36_9]|uniref:Large ribosomal subunit protein uL16 n=1 Tax=Berkelbacteria bacterium GW2011_GWA1_36_9 TaxID=1618331 RepID=A0A0G0IQC5_9BACT|nr:MAG: 50S ribosomal protein L16 [Berkelbacteria bacterium GW2011_GWA1_36_9]